MKTTTTFSAFLCLIVLCTWSMNANAQQVFSNTVPVPYAIWGPDWRIDIIDTTHNFDPMGAVTDVFNQSDGSALKFDLNVSVPAYAYNNPDSTNVPGALTYAGPTFIVDRTNTAIDFPIRNRVDTLTTVHWHALNLPAESDGGPHQRIKKDSTWHSIFPIIDEVQTAWYHSHLMDFTTDQVTRGMAGIMYVQEPSADPLYSQLPNEYGVNDFPLNIQAKNFVFDTIITPADTTYLVTAIKAGEKPGPGRFGMVNGVVGGSLHVPHSMVRLRMLNGSTIKILNIGLTKDPLFNYTSSSDSIHFETMHLIATGGGYVDYPRPFTNNLLSLGDRREFVFDFSQYNHGDTVYLTHFNNKLPGDTKYGGNWYSSAMCAFVVDTTIQPMNPVTSLPATLKPYDLAPGSVFKTRTKVLTGLSGGGAGGQQWLIDDTPMIMNVINDTVLVNTKEEWIINNTTAHAHPWHIHKVQFQVTEYAGTLGFPDGKGGYKDSSGIYTYPNLPDELFGYKDVQLIRDGAQLTYVARFDSFPSQWDMDSLFTHGFMYHCHILTHEDASMMHQFVVVDSLVPTTSVGEGEIRTLTLYPNPASNSIKFKGDYTDSGVLRFYDLNGRLLDERDIQSLPGSTISTDHLPRGIIKVEYVSGNIRFLEKLVLQ
ncbi:MAG: multicopper oxidase domain-containing protein [Crocinitomicaceae bacterium]|nr:multicopper oxidase domain-containing protein [Crocinitomicaceae bacterium]